MLNRVQVLCDPTGWRFLLPGILLCYFFSPALIVAQGPERPNIVFIMADDLGYGDLSCYGQQLMRTPNIDRLAQEGMRFTQAYAGGPVCAASRAVLMTGLHNGHAPARDNVPHYESYLEKEDVTVAEVLKSAGYATGGVGKWSLGDAGTAGRATKQGFDTWFGYLNQDHAHFYYTNYLDDDDGRMELSDNRSLRHTYSHQLLTDRAIEFVQNHRAEPFFLYVAYTLPHFSSKAEDPEGLAVPSIAEFDSKPWGDKAKKYAAMISMLDRDVGRIVRTIDSLDLDNTLIVFTSDNGGHSSVDRRFATSGKLRGYKRDLTEGGIRVPFIARWRGRIRKDQICSEVIAFQDMLPTFAELAGVDLASVEPLSQVDGISITRALNGGTLPAREYLYWDYGHCRRRYDQAVRWKNWKGIRHGASAIQLYDLDSDIGEKVNLAKQFPEVVEQIASIMDKAVTPNPRYPIGKIYSGKPIWAPK